MIYLNFRGLPTKYNEEGGKRTFNVVIDDMSMVEQLIEDGWNVKVRPPKDENSDPLYHLPVEVRYQTNKTKDGGATNDTLKNTIPPRVWLITSHGRTLLDEFTVGQLDYSDIVKCDLIVKGRDWDDHGTNRVKAYCWSLYATIEEDVFAAKYLYDDDEVPFE